MINDIHTIPLSEVTPEHMYHIPEINRLILQKSLQDFNFFWVNGEARLISKYSFRYAGQSPLLLIYYMETNQVFLDSNLCSQYIRCTADMKVDITDYVSQEAREHLKNLILESIKDI